MDSIALNFFPLLEQHRHVTAYRARVHDNSLEKEDDVHRGRLPKQEGDTDWSWFDVSHVKRDGYEPFEYAYSQNSYLSVYLMYQELLETLRAKAETLDYYLPKKAIRLKEVRFVTEKFEEGNTELLVKPFYLKTKQQFGFLIDHKFSLHDNQQFNRQTQIRSLSLDKSGKPNIYFYKDKKARIEAFMNAVLSPLLSSTGIAVTNKLSELPTKRLGVKTYLVGRGQEARSQFMGIKKSGPYRKVDKEVRYLFLFTERTKSLARDIYSGLVGKLYPGQFSGLEKMFHVPIRKDLVEHRLVDEFDRGAIDVIESQVQEILSQNSDCRLMVLAVLPRGFKGVDAAFDAYGHLKLMSLRNGVYCQVVTEDSFSKRDQLKWSVSNIGLQMFSKLGGAPWLVRPAKTECLIFGLGSVQEFSQGVITKYTAYTVCSDSSGDFRYIKPLASSEEEETYLDGLQRGLKAVLLNELDGKVKSLVLHLPYKISRKEIDTIKRAVAQIRESNAIEVVVVRVNTRHKFLGFSDHNTCVPYESTYTQLSESEFLLWAEGLQYGNRALHKRVSEPLYVDFIESKEKWTTKRDCLQDILNLTGANWRGFNSKAQPISILYSRLIARFMKEFSYLDDVQDMSMMSAKSSAPWFL